jgi:hypothetical protein
MMGERAVAQEALFYSFSLEQHVPQNRLCGLLTGSYAPTPVIPGARSDA